MVFKKGKKSGLAQSQAQKSNMLRYIIKTKLMVDN